ncbi:hypothetical protein ACS0TY_012209 [Phlomoides rotata]
MLMENSKKKSGGVEIPKRNRSLDLKSLYDSKFSEVINSKKKVSDENGSKKKVSDGNGSKKKVSDQNGGDDVKKKKRKNRKEVPLSCFESDAKRSRKENVDGVKSESGSRQKSNDRSEGLHGLSLGLGNNITSFNIPKRPRGSVGRKKAESDQGSEPTRLPNSEDSAGAFKAEGTKFADDVGPNDLKVREVTLSSANDCVSNIKSAQKVNGPNKKLKEKSGSKPVINSSGSNVKPKRKVGAEEVKETRNDQSASVHHVVKGNNRVRDNGDKLRKKQQTNSRKKKDLVVGRGGDDASAKKSEPSVGSSSDRVFSEFVEDDDDDEENLEQNAARMLSSRFDPNCTGFQSKRKSSVSQEAEGSSIPVSSPQDTLFRRLKSFGGGQSPSADDKNRMLRPRTENRGKGVARKRRHFYDVVAQNLDPYWVLNRRIKIFWPLDESWYYGLVDDYNSDTRHHHIKYDDREVEWVDLREEKFKLLLFPSEVPGKPKSRKRSKRDQDLQREQTVPSADNDSCIGDPLDSEPIASWLASQSQRVKALPKPLKRQRTSLPSEKTDNSNSDVVDSKVTIDDPDCEPASADSLPFQVTGNNRRQESTSILGSTSHAVYVRKRYRETRGVSSLSKVVKPRGSDPRAVKSLAPVIVSSPPANEGEFCRVGLDSDKQLWSLNDKGKLILNDLLLEEEEFRFQMCLPLLPPLEFSCDTGIFWLLHDMFMLQHGTVMTTSPAVILEILLIDSYFGLRLLLCEGCMERALTFVFQTLTVFSQSDEQWDGDMKLPVTSIRFQLSSFQDPRKRHVFAFYSFSRLKRSKWLYLDSKILQHCLLIKKLPVSECTYDNIKELQCGSFQLHKPRGGLTHSSNQGFKKNNMPGVLPMSVSPETCNSRISQPAFSLAAKAGNVPRFILSFAAAPTFFLSLHLQLLMEHSFAWVNLQHQDAPCSPERSDNGGQPDADCAQFEPSCGAVQKGTTGIEVRKLDTEPPSLSGLPSYQQDLGMDIVLASNAAKNTGGNPVNERVPKKKVRQQNGVSARTSVRTSIRSGTFNPRSDSTSGGMMIEVRSSEQVELPSDGKDCSNPIVSRSSWQHGGSSSISSPLGHHSPVWPDGKSNFTPNGFGNGPKKPRTQVQYTLPFAGYDLSEKPKTPSSRSLPCKRIRRASLKRMSDGSGNNQKNVELLTCVANVLVTHEDKGWREYGAHIVLEVADHNEWRLAVKLSGVTKYSYKVKHILQPGSTNRYSHAMMWKGGKDWVLEFPDRSQWMLFKEMHEECYDRNIRAASVKNIPIPGVRLVEESDDYGTDVPFVRNPMKYFRQVQTDVEMAMDPSHILYDIDSDDEKWLMKHNSRADKPEEITEEFFEKAIDMFEKVSYSQLRDNFTDDEIKELAIGLGSGRAAKIVCEHWKQKREKMGMPLIRHLQPPLWERYQQQVKEWERNHGNYASAVGSKEKVLPSEKPPMFAFCLKPRGLEVPNKGSKQRSHRKFPVSGHHHASSVDQDGFVFGRRSNGHVFGDDKMLYDSADVSPSLRASTRMLSPRDAHFALSNGVTEWKGNSKLYKNKSKKQLGTYPSFQNQRPMGQRNGVQQWNTPEFSNQKHCFLEKRQLPHRLGTEQLDGSDLNEFRIRDAAIAAEHARNLAKLKRERAQKLFDAADYAMQKAARTLMAAEAIKECCGNSKK